MKLTKAIITYVITLLFTVGLCASYEVSAQSDKNIEALYAENKALQGHIDKLEQDTAVYGQRIADLSTQIEQQRGELAILQQQISEKQDKADRSGERRTKRIMEVTAYWEGSCDKPPDDPLYGITASGAKVREWYTIAAGPELPFGTQIYIPYFREMPNNGVFVVADRGRDITDGRLDIYLPAAADCSRFGRVKGMEVWVLE